MGTIRDLLDEAGVPYHAEGRETRPGWVNLRCVRCGKDPYLGINLTWSYGNCWSCGHVPLAEVLREVCHLKGVALKDALQGLPRHSRPAREVHRGTLRVPAGVGPMAGVHRDYCASRGFDPDYLAEVWGVQGIGLQGGRLRWRLYIPVHLKGVVVSWTTRAIGKGVEPRYWSAKDDESAVPIRDCLYGVDAVRHSTLVAEGPTGAWRVGPGAVAILGSRLYPSQRVQLARVPDRIVCLDPEPVAQRRARQYCRDLAVYDGVTRNLVVRTGPDLAEASEEEVRAIRKLLL